MTDLISNMPAREAGAPQATVLLVDDEPVNLRLLVEALKEDYDIRIATSGENALKLLDEIRPDLILLDVMMPGMDGFELCRRIKQRPEMALVPVIFITAMTDPVSEESGFNLGAIDYIYKPIQIPVTKARLRVHLENSHLITRLEHLSRYLREKIRELESVREVVTEQNKALEEALSEKNLLSHVFLEASEGIVITDTEYKICAVNKAFTRITGYSEAETLGHSPDLLHSGFSGISFMQEVESALSHEGHWHGELYSRRKNGESYPEMRTVSSIKNEDGEVTHYLMVFSDISSIKAQENQIHFLTWYDPLTGLPNQKLLQNRLETLLTNPHSQGLFSAVVVISIDNYKRLSQFHGLLKLDQFIKEFANRVESITTDAETLSRMSGASDEFVVLLGSYAERKAAIRAAEQFCKALQRMMEGSLEPQDSGGVTFSCISGINVFQLHHALAAPAIIQQAVIAQQSASQREHEGYIYYDDNMGTVSQYNFDLERELAVAIDQDQMQVYFQSQVDHAGNVVGVESLVRWLHPERGLVPPDHFIPLAESSFLIVDLDRWMLKRVLLLLDGILAQGKTLQVSVNISTLHFNQSHFVEDIKALLTDHPDAAKCLTFELTESSMISDVDRGIAKMEALKESGVSFSIDDFGTGYSSLSYLKKLPISEVKLDKAFVLDAPDDINDAQLVELVYNIASLLNLRVVAEGVETERHADLLSRYSGLVQQGFLYSRPEQAERWLEAWLANDN
ncbi:EAL domain-containing protein [Neptuniibacter sp. CAU 1671]|uniref:two-component system response regulator n=1 Tax=Neptuniibacter sp. CAU 1671 TaxID=3032593 RepID=UPI0023DA2289|nr:EAL domain-containing protein [Neptuniibacter sp. CAU 1671]MDF2181092.1 EAL domain-containing protein [Neptuniibacter sp. CAU 1671]